MAKTAKVQNQTKSAKIPKDKSGKTKVTHMSTSSEVVGNRGRVNFAKAFIWPRTAPAYQYIGQAKGLTVEINLEL